MSGLAFAALTVVFLNISGAHIRCHLIVAKSISTSKGGTVGDALETLNPASRRKVQYLQQNKVYLYCLLKVQLFPQPSIYLEEYKACSQHIIPCLAFLAKSISPSPQPSIVPCCLSSASSLPSLLPLNGDSTNILHQIESKLETMTFMKQSQNCFLPLLTKQSLLPDTFGQKYLARVPTFF